MQQKLGKWSLRFTEAPFILESSSVVGTKEADGPLGGPGLAVKITDTFLNTPFSNDERHIRRSVLSR